MYIHQTLYCTKRSHIFFQISRKHLQKLVICQVTKGNISKSLNLRLNQAGVLISSWPCEETDTGSTPSEDGEWPWGSYRPRHQGLPANCHELGRGKEGFPDRSQRHYGAGTLIWDLLPPELWKSKFLLFEGTKQNKPPNQTKNSSEKPKTNQPTFFKPHMQNINIKKKIKIQIKPSHLEFFKKILLIMLGLKTK